MKRIHKGLIIIAVIFGFILKGSVASAAGADRYVDDIADHCIVTKDIPFSEVKDYTGDVITLKLDVYEPADDPAVNRPVIIWVHGGNMRFGVKEDYESLCLKLALKGFVVIPVNYRVNPNTYENEVTWYKTMNEAAIDIESALKWAKENAEIYGLDPNNIILGGHSAGAEIIDNVYYDDYFYPEFDRTGITACIDLSGWNLFRAPVDEVTKIGNPNTKCLVIHGKIDDITPISEAEIFAKQIGDRGVIKFMDNRDHYWNGEGQVLVVNTITEFLNDNITYAESTQATSEESTFFKQLKTSTPKYTFCLGEKKPVSMKVILPEVSDKIGKITVTYGSSNTNVANVNSNGEITLKAIGTASINAKVSLANGKSKYISSQITVNTPYIEIIKSTPAIKKGKTFTFEAKAYGLDEKNTVWSSTNKSILVINKKTGKVTAKSKGVAFVVAENGTYFKTIMVEVK